MTITAQVKCACTRMNQVLIKQGNQVLIKQGKAARLSADCEVCIRQAYPLCSNSKSDVSNVNDTVGEQNMGNWNASIELLPLCRMYGQRYNRVLQMLQHKPITT